jgi:hypothetical protein
VQGGVRRDEGGRERALAEEILEEVRDAERRREGIRGVGGAEEVCGGAAPDEPGDPAQEDAKRDEQRPAAGGRGARDLSRMR